MSVIPALQNVLGDSVHTGTTTSAGPGPEDLAVNLVIESLDEFASGIVLMTGTTADYVIRTALSPAYN